jgi:hypothetical protein
MQCLTSARETCRLILISLFPESTHRIVKNISNNDTRLNYKTYYAAITEKKVPPYHHDPDFPGFPIETVRLFFPNTNALAAPLLLFRMKRRGFSASKVTVQNGGLLLTATR